MTTLLKYHCIDPLIRTQFFEKFLDDELDENARQEFANHMNLCAKCRDDVEYWEWIITVLKQELPNFFP